MVMVKTLHTLKRYRLVAICLLINLFLIVWHKSLLREQSEEEKARIDRLQTMQAALIAFYRPQQQAEKEEIEKPKPKRSVYYATLSDYQKAGEYASIKIDGDKYDIGDYYDGQEIAYIEKTRVILENGIVYHKKQTKETEKSVAANPAGV